MRSSAHPRPRRHLRLAWRWGRWIALISLIALNVHWSLDAARPEMDLKAIERLVDSRQSDKAEGPLRRKLARSPNDGDARALLARILAQRGDTLGCARELGKVPFWWPNRARWSHMEGTAFKEVERMREAEAAWQVVVKDDPFHPVETKLLLSAALELLELFAVEGRWAEAADLIWNLHDRLDDPRDQEALLVMRIRTELERITPAVAAEKLAGFLRADADDWEARRALAKTKIALGKPDEAKSLLEDCISQRPEDPRGWADYLAALQDLGEPEELRAAIGRIPSEVADDPGLLRPRAFLLERDRRWAAAAALYRKLIAARPWERAVYYHLALLEDRLGNKEAGRNYRKQSERMRVARLELNDAFQKVLDLRREQGDSAATREAIRHLAEVCRELGWARDADGWARLAGPAS